MTVSLEAIILTIIVLMSQNRQSYIASLRDELQLQVNLLAEKKFCDTQPSIEGASSQQHTVRRLPPTRGGGGLLAPLVSLCFRARLGRAISCLQPDKEPPR